MLSGRTAVPVRDSYYVHESCLGSRDDVNYRLMFHAPLDSDSFAVIRNPEPGEQGVGSLVKLFFAGESFDPGLYAGRDILYFGNGFAGEMLSFGEFDTVGEFEKTVETFRRASAYFSGSGERVRFAGRDRFSMFLDALLAYSRQWGKANSSEFLAGPIDAYSPGYSPYVPGVSLVDVVTLAQEGEEVLGYTMLGFDHWSGSEDAVFDGYCLGQFARRDQAKARHQELASHLSRPDLYLEEALRDGMSRELLRQFAGEAGYGDTKLRYPFSWIDDFGYGKKALRVDQNNWRPVEGTDFGFEVGVGNW